MSKHLVYFLGAGCSKNFGYPLTNEIMPAIMQSLLKHDMFQLDDYKKTRKERELEKELLHYLYLFYPGLKQLNINSRTSRLQIPGITEVLSMVDHCCFYNQTPHPEMNNAHLIEMRELLNRAVVELILEYERRPMNRNEEQLFNKFVEPIWQRSSEDKLSIITTNYDLLIDWEYSDLLAANKIDLGISYRDVESNELLYRDSEPGFNYYKLHGSLNWLRCDLCGHYYMNPEGLIIANAFFEGFVDYNTCVCNNRLRLKPVLVAPSIIRDIRDPNLLQIWKSAMEAIRTSDEIVFVGYSLPAEDLAIRSLIMRGINGRKNSKKPKIDVVQMGNSAKNNYVNLLGPDIKYHEGGLQQFLK